MVRVISDSMILREPSERGIVRMSKVTMFEIRVGGIVGRLPVVLEVFESPWLDGRVDCEVQSGFEDGVVYYSKNQAMPYKTLSECCAH